MKLRFPFKVLALALYLAGMGPALAADESTALATQSLAMDQFADAPRASNVTSKFAEDFARFAGSQEDAEAIISGLRTGTQITLDGATITPPTKPMGYGNTYISMSLAKAQLAQYGITEPTPEQLNAALTGGTITVTKVGADGVAVTKTVTLDGILTQRASGMGWGQIAKANGFKLGQVISGMKAANTRLASSATGAASMPPAATPQHRSLNAATSGAGTKAKYLASRERITNSLSGGGIIYGRHPERTSAKLASLDSFGAAHGQGGGVSNAAGGAGGSVASNGKSGGAPGQHKAGK